MVLTPEDLERLLLEQVRQAALVKLERASLGTPLTGSSTTPGELFFGTLVHLGEARS